MEPCRSLGLLAGALALATMVVALSTDYWFVAIGPAFSAHTGLWPSSPEDNVSGYIHVTQSFTILSTLLGLGAVVFLVLSYIPALSAPGRGPLVSTITAFVAALFALTAMAIYTSERWSQIPHAQIQSFFSWSFYLGWVSTLLLICTGGLSLAAHCRSPPPGYESM